MKSWNLDEIRVEKLPSAVPYGRRSGLRLDEFRWHIPSRRLFCFFLLTTTPFTQPQDFVCLLYQWPSRQEIPGQVRRRQMISHLLLSCITHVGEGDGCINYLRSNPTQRLFEITHTSLSDEDCEVLFRWLTTGGGVSSQQGVSLCLRTQRINFTSSP